MARKEARMTDEQIKLAEDFFADMAGELHEDLVPYLDTDLVIPMVRHPLVYEHYMPGMCGHINKRYQYKQQALDKAVEEGKWTSYIFLHERPYRLNALLRASHEFLFEELTDYWEAVGAVWIDSENIWQNFAEWKELWWADDDERIHAMDEDDRAEFAKLPETLTVYRGAQYKKSFKGLSWTTDRDKALWFARRYRHSDLKSHLLSGTIRREHVLATFHGRGESEIVLFPENLTNYKIETVE